MRSASPKRKLRALAASVLGILVIPLFLMIFVVPLYRNLFVGFGIEVPIPTRVAFGIDRSYEAFLIAFALVIICAALLHRRRRGA